MWLWLVTGMAWSASWALRVPDRQDTSAWEDALLLTGLSLASSSTPNAAEVVFVEGRWWLRVPASDGSGWRRATIPAPDSPAAREEIARQARNMLADPGEGIESRWEPDFAALLPPSTSALPPTPPPRPPPPPPSSPALLVPRLGAAAPRLAESPSPRPSWPIPMPTQVVSYPWSLRLPSTQDTPAAPDQTPWLRLGAGPSWRPQVTPSMGILVEGGVPLREHVSLGAGGTWLSRADLSALPGTRAVQGSSLHAGLWWTLSEALPLQGGMLLGIGWLRFQQDGTNVDRLLRPQLSLEAAYGSRLQGFVRATTELWPVALVEEDGASALGTLYPGLWGGARFQVPLTSRP